MDVPSSAFTAKSCVCCSTALSCLERLSSWHTLLVDGALSALSLSAAIRFSPAISWAGDRPESWLRPPRAATLCRGLLDRGIQFVGKGFNLRLILCKPLLLVGKGFFDAPPSRAAYSGRVCQGLRRAFSAVVRSSPSLAYGCAPVHRRTPQLRALVPLQGGVALLEETGLRFLLFVPHGALLSHFLSQCLTLLLHVRVKTLGFLGGIFRSSSSNVCSTSIMASATPAASGRGQSTSAPKEGAFADSDGDPAWPKVAGTVIEAVCAVTSRPCSSFNSLVWAAIPRCNSASFVASAVNWADNALIALPKPARRALKPCSTLGTVAPCTASVNGWALRTCGARGMTVCCPARSSARCACNA